MKRLILLKLTLIFTPSLQKKESPNLHNLSAKSEKSEFQEDGIPAPFNPGEHRTISKGSTLGTFTILEADTAAQNHVVLEQN